jgi:AraC-like DNA-binding protein
MPALLRSASLTDFAEVARSVGLSPHAMLAQAKLPSNVLVDPDLKVPAAAVHRLLELCAEQSGIPSFGLRMAQARRLSNLGPVGLLVREEPTLRRALDALVHFGHLLNSALHLEVEEAGAVVIIREEIVEVTGAPVRQATELAIGVMFRLLTVFLGPDWRPRRVCFAHKAPKDRAEYTRAFGRGVEFGSEFNGIVCSARDLDVPNPTADPVIARYARQVLEASLAGRDRRVSDDVRQLVFVLLPAGHCGIKLVARHLGVDRRTVHRQLQREGETFSGIIEAVRRELLKRYLDDGSRPLGEVAGLLGFSAPSAFSRWYRKDSAKPRAKARSSHASSR